MKHGVKTYREAGLEARWSKRNGRPVITVRDPIAPLEHQRQTWWIVSLNMFEDMKKDGIREAFRNHTLLGDIFSI